MKRQRLHLHVKVLAIVALLAVMGVVGLFLMRDDLCPAGSIVHEPAGTCIEPNKLVVTGSFEDVDDAVAEFGGHALPSRGSMRHVVLPVGDLNELDRIKAALEAEGFLVQYAVAYTTG